MVLDYSPCWPNRRGGPLQARQVRVHLFGSFEHVQISKHRRKAWDVFKWTEQMNSNLPCLQWPGVLSAARVYDRRWTNHALALVIRTTKSLGLPTVKLREPVRLLPSTLFRNPNRVAQIGDLLNKGMGPQLFTSPNWATLFGLLRSAEGRSLEPNIWQVRLPVEAQGTKYIVVIILVQNGKQACKKIRTNVNVI